MKQTVRRLLVLLLALCLLLSLAACSGTMEKDTGVAGKDAKPGIKTPTPGMAPEAGPSKPGSTEKHDDPADPSLPAWEGKGEINSYSFLDTAKSAADGSSTAGIGSEGGSPVEPVAPADGEGAGEGGAPILGSDTSMESASPAEPLKLTAAEWKDNANWPFFTNLVNNGTIAFPSFGLDPRNRVEVQVTNTALTASANETVQLLDAEGKVLWTARTDKNGVAYLFWAEGQTPDRVVCGEASAPVQVEEPSGDAQSKPVMKPLDKVVLDGSGSAPVQTGMQIMFIVDTTGSMGDELAYLQKDFSAIAERVGSQGVRYSVSFYRDEGDEYVTRHSEFSSDVAEIQAKINAEYADGGGDTPEAVAEVLNECLKDRDDWDESCVKLAFLIFDAPPHEGKESELQAAVQAAAEQGIRLIPVVASNADRETELFGRAIAILTGGTYVFLTDDSGIGDSHLEPIVGNYEVELLQDLIVRVIDEYRA